MNELSNLKKPAGSTHRYKRVGRGQASGLGKTAGRGNKGQKSRTGNMGIQGFEGGQTPLQRRIPKRGFTNIFRKEYEIVSLDQLAKKFDAGAVADIAALRAAGLVKKGQLVKVLGDGELTGGITVFAHRFSASAKAKLEAAGGKAELVATKPTAAVDAQ